MPTPEHSERTSGPPEGRTVEPRLPAEIVTPRLLLRLWRATDVPVLSGAIATSIDHLRPWLAWTRDEPIDDDARLALIESGHAAWRRGGDANYGAFRDGVLVGACGLHHRRGPRTLDLGYWVHVDHLRRGYAAEMAGGLTSAAFRVPGVERVEIHHDRANLRSSAVPRSLGFDVVGESPDGVDASGEEGVDVCWAVGRDDWVTRTSDEPPDRP